MPRRRNSYFQCRQFRIEQGDCAMKVTTDASLLGAWAPVGQARRLLDIGTGTGLLALFAAQRSPARIDAVEVDAAAAEQARQNFAASPWADRLQLIEGDIRDLARDMPGQYDAILCNPPFFSASTPNRCERLARARHNDALPLADLLDVLERLLSGDGRAWLLLPPKETGEVLAGLEQRDLHPRGQLEVCNDADSEPHRIVLQLEKRPGPCAVEEIRLYERHPFHTEEAAQLFEPYYVKLRRRP
ncbi:tRNA1(Val) (adenine(37)-N6)-methyltransferase [Marinobacterium aestuariivivens]|uniref:tRNA1(Val) (adenine(37)-N6)-methyltransferase n=1 Tax=Marinobacterium aestuariivivens TaxID=1698799 RepID=A0ABW1ZTU1_9GAMM